MAFPFVVNFFVFAVSHLLLILHSAADKYHDNCPEFMNCGTLGQIKFPFTNFTYDRCGFYWLQCSEVFPKIDSGPYEVIKFLNDETVMLKGLETLARSKNCDIFSDSILPGTSSVSFRIIPPILTLFRCNTTTAQLRQQAYHYFGRNHRNYSECSGFTVFYEFPPPPQYHRVPIPGTGSMPPNCLSIQLPVLHSPSNHNASSDIFSLIPDEFSVKWYVSSECLECRHNGGQCPREFGPFNPRKFQCQEGQRNYVKWIPVGTGRRNHKWILVTVIPGGIILLLCMLRLAIWRHKKWIHVSSYSRNTSSDPSSRADLEGGSIFFGIPLYSYVELKEATNNFDPSKELGNGGFGTVYHGKLQDGREVAVKRLYEHNYKRVTQFINEIEILTRLRHPNLVSLYGCTSRHCRELLLVYEYIPNGTVADHLYGDRARDGSLTWPIRMNIAIETASALAYLHASDIIHRDVKTNNILLDNNFNVKVADFGLSRLFPNDVTHVSTAPQGTPGYVDPEYHQCYQLTSKSDVYSFGVVLIELISSMPAVDISRHKHEINLANLAMNRIQHRAFNELIDPSFGFEPDSSIERMTTSVAEVAFRCLQLGKEMRPTMDEVLEALKKIQEYNDENTAKVSTEDVNVLTSKLPPPLPEGDHVGLLLKDRKVLTSPDSVTNIWNSGGSTTTSISSG